MVDIYSEDGGRNAGAEQDGPGGDPLKAEAQAAREKLSDAAQAIKGEASHFAEAARDKASDTVDRGKEAAASAVGDFADAIRKAGDELGQKDQTMAARLVSQAAEGLETLSRTVSEKRPEDMLNAVRDFGRSNPTAFLAGAVLAGLALGRFARSSAQHEHPSSQDMKASPPQPGDDKVFDRAAMSFADVRGDTTSGMGSAIPVDVADLGVLGDDEARDETAPQTGI